jgi:hypothetical protein
MGSDRRAGQQAKPAPKKPGAPGSRGLAWLNTGGAMPNVVEANADLGNTNGWHAACQVTLTNLFQSFPCEGTTNRTMFYRARKD